MSDQEKASYIFDGLILLACCILLSLTFYKC